MRDHSNPTGHGYSTSPNFNEMYAKKMAELPPVAPAKRKPRVKQPANPTAHGYSTSPDFTAKVAHKLLALHATESDSLPHPPALSRRRKPAKVKP